MTNRFRSRILAITWWNILYSFKWQVTRGLRQRRCEEKRPWH